jgi:hypothetical protein
MRLYAGTRGVCAMSVAGICWCKVQSPLHHVKGFALYSWINTRRFSANLASVIRLSCESHDEIMSEKWFENRQYRSHRDCVVISDYIMLQAGPDY